MYVSRKMRDIQCERLMIQSKKADRGEIAYELGAGVSPSNLLRTVGGRDPLSSDGA
jgi:hypothetical protein